MTTPQHLPRGPVMADVAAFQLTDEERVRLCDPAIGGVILFRRNYQSRAQLTELVADIKALRHPELIVAVDHEGGRVQRFIDGFTRLPAMRVLGELWDAQGAEAAQAQAETVGWVLAVELAACGVDLSFTPVLDLDWGPCAVIGNRSFHRDAGTVSALALALQRGLNRGGMKSCGKHFPGHGCVSGDSHLTLPEDTRSLDAIRADDIRPFAALSAAGMAAVMPAHVVYPQVDAQPAGFSQHWLQDILRGEVGFDGVIFSDDLTMEGAGGAGDIRARAEQAFAAGCDIVLVCNRPDWVDVLRRDFQAPANPHLAARWQYMAATLSAAEAQVLMQSAEFQAAQAAVAALVTPQDTAGGVKVGEAF
ncbi:beta-N-acetylhexosaminidase [Neisseria sp. HSC-16F19]|nr:beta-N-acetylhexosaminidase [Neisseria sp. HSC-16F19]MCP2040122.1 beta-N-acetylhexosaminidase [Neisseria sp. HSC-16F19]